MIKNFHMLAINKSTKKGKPKVYLLDGHWLALALPFTFTIHPMPIPTSENIATLMRIQAQEDAAIFEAIRNAVPTVPTQEEHREGYEQILRNIEQLAQPNNTTSNTQSTMPYVPPPSRFNIIDRNILRYPHRHPLQ